MYSASARAALNSALPARAITVSKPDGASSRAMSIALSGLSASRIFGAIVFPPRRLFDAEDSRRMTISPEPALGYSVVMGGVNDRPGRDDTGRGGESAIARIDLAGLLPCLLDVVPRIGDLRIGRVADRVPRDAGNR